MDLIYEPAEKLKSIFERHGDRFVVFVEVAELEMIDSKSTDSAIDLVKRQLQDFHLKNFELGLHLHPQWYNGQYDGKNWLLDYSEYNLCIQPRERIVQIIDRSISYLRRVLDKEDFVPFSFRAGNWLFQPSRTVAEVLAERGIKVDSSVFKGGVQHQHNLNYKRSLKNGYYWKFTDEVNVPDPNGLMLELPIHTEMVPTYKMLTAKRVGMQRKGSSVSQTYSEKLYRLRDFMRLQFPLKFDFCRMTIEELTSMVDKVILEDQQNPTLFRPIVAIGHTKDLVDFVTVEKFLTYLRNKNIPVTSFKTMFNSCS